MIFCAYVTFLNQREVIYAYASGLLFSVLIVTLMSLVGILPIRTSDGFVTYGFGNPNSIGGFLACIFMSYLYLTWKKSRIWFLILYVVITIINSVTFGDRSASVCMLIYLFAYLIRGYINKKCKLIGWMGIIMLIFLTFFSLILAYFYGRFNWIYSIDHVLTKRIYTWNYYLNIDGIHLFPQSMNIVKANEYEIGFYGKNIDPLLRGFFDGGYIFMLIRMGIINAILIIGVIGNKFLELMRYHKTSLELLLLIFVFYTLPENEWIAPYAFYTSYLLVVCFSQMKFNKY